MGYRDENNYPNVDHDRFTDLMSRIDDDLGNSTERFIRTYREKYAGQFPIWVAVEVMSFGDLSKLYNLLPIDMKKKISRIYDNLDESMLTNWMQCSALLRNICAHNSRIYARSIPRAIKIETSVRKQEKNKFNVTVENFSAGPHTLFSYLLAFRRVSLTKTWNSFLPEFEALLVKYQNVVEPTCLGMHGNWKYFLSKKQRFLQ